ncbi:MAG TPA: hypothetical protein VGD42_17915 [Lysobacter sp.]
MRIVHVLVGLCLSAGIAAAAPPAAAPAPLMPDAKVGGETFGNLTARWWQWAHHLPVVPYQDPDGRFCELGQEGPVWFLAGTDGSFTARRECVVPSGKYVLVPVINMVVRDSGDPEYARSSCAQLQASAALNNDHLASAVVMLDGVRLADVARYRVRSEGCFHVGRDEDSPLAAADGYWLLFEPLPPGRHHLVVGANYGAGDEDAGYGRMVQNFEYVLHVGGRIEHASMAPSASARTAGL